MTTFCGNSKRGKRIYLNEFMNSLPRYNTWVCICNVKNLYSSFFESKWRTFHLIHIWRHSKLKPVSLNHSVVAKAIYWCNLIKIMKFDQKYLKNTCFGNKQVTKFILFWIAISLLLFETKPTADTIIILL